MTGLRRFQCGPLALAGIVALGLAVAGCSDSAHSGTSKSMPAQLVTVGGTDVKQVVLSERAAQRIDIQMTPIATQGSTQVIPYASVVYDKDGSTWVYTSPAPLTFTRTAITIASIAGGQAMLSSGPAAGTGVVTVGTAELFGVEKGIGQTGGGH